MLSIDGSSPKSRKSGLLSNSPNVLWLWKRACTLVLLPLWIGLSVLILILQLNSSPAAYNDHLEDLTELALEAKDAEKRKILGPKAALIGTSSYNKWVAERVKREDQSILKQSFNSAQIKHFEEELKAYGDFAAAQSAKVTTTSSQVIKLKRRAPVMKLGKGKVDIADIIRSRKKARAEHAARGPAKLPSLVWMAPFFAGGGYSSEAISYMLGLQSIYKERKQKLGLREFAEHPNPEFQNGLPKKVATALTNLERAGAYTSRWDVAICHATPDVWLEDGAFGWGMIQKCPPDDTRFSIGRTMYETDRLPNDWVARINQLDEVWVPSKFAVQQFESSGVSSEKIVVMPEAVETDFFDPAKHTPLKPKDAEKFRFISVFKWEKRKGWDVLLRAFFEEFSAEDPVELLVKTNVFYEGDFRDQVIAYAGSLSTAKKPLAAYKILDNQVPLEELPRLYLMADAFVIPTRGEGWGRPIVEAMSMGLPVIATNWSGPTEFLTKENSLPLKITGVSPVEGGIAGHQWAEPSVSHLRQLMRWTTANPKDAMKLGAQARRDMVERYSPKVVIQHHVLPQLERIAAKLGDEKRPKSARPGVGRFNFGHPKPNTAPPSQYYGLV